MKKRSVPLGMLALVFVGLQAVVYARQGRPENLLWACNIATFAIAAGLLIPSPSVNAVGAFWLAAGFPLWIFDFIAQREFLPTSLLTHVGGLIVGYIGIKRLGLPNATWWVAMGALGALMLLCRVATPAETNLNLAHRVYDGSTQLFSSYLTYLMMISAAFTAAFAGLQWCLRKLGVPRP